MKKSREDVIQRLKFRLREKYDINTLELVERHFWIALRHYLTNPDKVTESILLNEFLKFELRINKIKWALENKKDISKPKRELYEKIIKKHEQQKNGSKEG